VGQLNSERPAKLVTTIEKTLQKDREQRFQSASDVAAARQALPDSGNAATFAVPRAKTPRKHP